MNPARHPNRATHLRVGLAVLGAVILVGSVVPVPGGVPETEPTGTVGITTLAHIAGYAALAAGGVVYAGLTGWPATTRRLSTHQSKTVGGWIAVVLVVSLFGVATELIQAMIPWRTAAVSDVVINTVSAVCGALVAGAMRFYASGE